MTRVGREVTGGRLDRESGDVRAHVVGVDPGLNRTGYAVMSLAGGELLLHEAGVIRSTSKLSLAERVAEVSAREAGEGASIESLIRVALKRLAR